METSLISKYILPVVIALIMFNLGLSLKITDFKRTFTFPRALLIGLCCQLLLLPLIAFLLAHTSGLSPALKIGIVIIAACPGGATSNLISYLLKGDVALSISLTAVNSILVLFSIPGILFVALQTFSGKEQMVSLPFWSTMLNVFVMILTPTFLGMLTRYKYEAFATKTEGYMKYITTLLLAIVFGVTIFDNNSSTDNSLQKYFSIAPIALGLNILGMLSGLLVGKLAGFGKKKLITLAVEVGIQNSALAITIASSQGFLGNTEMAIPAVVYGLFTFFNAVVFGYLIKKWPQ